MDRTLNHRQRATAERVAKDIIGSPAPHWSDLGGDIKEEKYATFLEQLAKSNDKGIANVLEQNKGLALTLLQQKAKSMRSEEKRKAVKGHSEVSPKLFESTQVTSQVIKKESPLRVRTTHLSLRWHHEAAGRGPGWSHSRSG